VTHCTSRKSDNTHWTNWKKL